MLNTDEYAQLSKQERDIYDAASPDEAAAFAAAWRDVNDDYRASAPTITSTSVMRDIGRTGTFVTFALGVLLLVIDASIDRPVFHWAVIVLSVCGTCLFAWMLGAIEVRLIEINETLKSQNVEFN